MAKKRCSFTNPIYAIAACTAVFFLCLLCGAYLIGSRRIGEEHGQGIVLCAAFLSGFLARIFLPGEKREETIMLIFVPWCVLLLCGLALFWEIDLYFLAWLLAAFAFGGGSGAYGKRVARKKNKRGRRSRS